jgi:hypothetical protein
MTFFNTLTFFMTGKNELSNPTNSEFMKAMIAKMGIVESAIRANTEQVGLLPDLKEILQGVGKRATA